MYQRIRDPGDNTISNNDYVTLMQSSPRLVHVEIAHKTIGMKPAEALLRLHGRWLEIVVLTSEKGSTFTFASANRLLSSCPNLISFELTLRARPEMPDLAQSLFQDDWQNPRMERFKLVRCTRRLVGMFSSHKTLSERARLACESAMDSELLKRVLVNGWGFDRGLHEKLGPKMDLTEIRRLRNRVFMRLLDLPRMHSISVEGYEFSRRLP